MNKADQIVSENLQKLFKDFLTAIEKTTGELPAVSVCIFNTEPNGRVNYISNCDRSDVASAWTELLEHWEKGLPNIPAHKMQ